MRRLRRLWPGEEIPFARGEPRGHGCVMIVEAECAARRGAARLSSSEGTIRTSRTQESTASFGAGRTERAPRSPRCGAATDRRPRPGRPSGARAAAAWRRSPGTGREAPWRGCRRGTLSSRRPAGLLLLCSTRRRGSFPRQWSGCRRRRRRLACSRAPLSLQMARFLERIRCVHSRGGWCKTPNLCAVGSRRLASLIEEACWQLCWLCSAASGDPANLDEEAIAEGALDSLVENPSDGLVAPPFSYCYCGPMGALL